MLTAVAREFLTGRADGRLLIDEEASLRLIRWSRRSTGVLLRQRRNHQLFHAYLRFYRHSNRAGALCQAGHPTPFICRDGELRTVGLGGVPVGLFPQSEYQSCEFLWHPANGSIFTVTASANVRTAREALWRNAAAAVTDRASSAGDGRGFQRVERELGDWSRPEPDGLAEYGRFFNDDISLVAIRRTA